MPSFIKHRKNDPGITGQLDSSQSLGTYSKRIFLKTCAGFGLDRVKFLHNSLYRAMFWICDENSVNNAEGPY